MRKVLDLELYIGSKEEVVDAMRRGFSIVSAMNRAGNYHSHQKMIGWTGRGCDQSHPEYLYGIRGNWLALNMIDCDNPDYYHNDMIDAALDFIDSELSSGKKVLVHCSLGESRAPSIAFLYLLHKGLIANTDFRSSLDEFLRVYEKYQPKLGLIGYIQRRFFKGTDHV